MDDSSPLVSIVLCTYNGEQFLKEQLASLVTQTYPNLEIIIVDDNSSDGTKDLLISFTSLHDNIQLFFNECNLGYNRNFEKALSLTNGKYISICDQDDIWFPDKIEKLAGSIGDNWAIFSNSEFIDWETKSMSQQLISTDLLMDGYKSILLENFFTGHTSLLSRESFKYILPIPEYGFYDWWIGFVCLYHQKLVFHNEVLTYYRVHQKSVTQYKKKKKHSIIEDLDIQLGIFLEYPELEPRDKDFITDIRRKLKTVGIFNPLLYDLIINYSKYFPQRNHKNPVSRLNFLRKFLKRRH
ncbi:glycosyltransferase [Daejeonella sp.]|uniref:glycosyltransferase n=1 Tax=Daejeonella sp. TaxID=2805397 RepID=UPI0039836C20